MILFAMITAVVSTFLNFVFAKRWNKNMGIDDIFFLFFTDVVFSTIQTLLYSLPIMALFAKITPKRIEGTTFAFLTGTMNFASTVISPGMGTLINHEFVHVNKRDLSNYSTLCLIAFICAIVTFVLLPLIPTKLQIREFRDKRDIFYEEIKKKRRERRAIK
jgi:MFS family permease